MDTYVVTLTLLVLLFRCSKGMPALASSIVSRTRHHAEGALRAFLPLL
jgi:hypothetical protein